MKRVWMGVALILACAAATGTARAQDEEAGNAGTPGPEAAASGDEAGEAEPEKQPRTVDLTIQGSEPDRWNLDVGGSWNEHDGLYGRLALSTRNFLGRGEVFGVTLELGDEHELYEIRYGTPFLFGRRQSLGIRLFKDASDHPVAGGADFGRRSAGADLTWGRRFGKHQSFELDYRFADVDERESMIGSDGGPLQRRSAYVSSSIRPRWVWDSLDDRFSPLRGLRLEGSLEVAGGVLGGDAELVKPTFGLTWFRPLSKRPLRSTLGVRTRVGWLHAGRTFPQQRFFTGGEDHVRGFRSDSIAVLGDDGRPALDGDGFPLGGERLAQLNLEYHLLLDKRFRLVLFADAGGVFSEGQSLDSDRLRKSAGAELRVSLPRLRLPLRLIWARNLEPLPGDRFDDWSFSVGVSF